VTGSLDTSVVLRLLVGEPPDLAARAADLLTRDTAFISDAAIIESCFVLKRHYGLDRRQQVAALVGLLAQPGIDSRVDVLKIAFEHYLEHPALSFEDCYLVAISERDEQGPLWTFDRTLATQLTGAELVP
jgi:predicted nucleic acid-binding protein